MRTSHLISTCINRGGGGEKQKEIGLALGRRIEGPGTGRVDVGDGEGAAIGASDGDVNDLFQGTGVVELPVVVVPVVSIELLRARLDRNTLDRVAVVKYRHG